MTRHKDNARQQLIEVMLDIVRERGAAALTYDNLVARSGLTRGGVMYHFPSKDSMLQGLLQAYLEAESARIDMHWARHGRTTDGLLKAEIDASREPDDRHHQVNVTLLPVIMGKPEMMAQIRDAVGQRYDLIDDASAGFEMAAVILLAIDGLEMARAFGISALEGERRDRVLTFMASLVDGKGRTE